MAYLCICILFNYVVKQYVRRSPQKLHRFYLSCKGCVGKPPQPSEEELVQRIELLCLKPPLAQFDTNDVQDLSPLRSRAWKTEMKTISIILVLYLSIIVSIISQYFHVTVVTEEPYFKWNVALCILKAYKSDLACLRKAFPNF